MKKKSPALPVATLLTILLFTVPVFLLIGYLVLQIQTARQVEVNIDSTKKQIVTKEQEISTLQTQLEILHKIKESYKSHLQEMKREFEKAELNRQRLTDYAPYPPKNTMYPESLTNIPKDIKAALKLTKVQGMKIHIEEANRPGFTLGTVKAYGTLEQLYRLKIELLRLTYIDSIRSSMIQSVANQKFITLKFWIRTL